MSIEIDTIGGNCPVQAEGFIDGEPFYFRARGRRWSIDIGVEADGQAEWTHSEAYPGGPFAAGWISEAEARAFIAKGAQLWRARGGVDGR